MVMSPFQANTNSQAGSPLGVGTGNWFLDGINDTIATIGQGAQVWTQVENNKTANEIAILNAQAQLNPQGQVSSPSPRNIVEFADNKELQKIMFIVGATMIVFSATVLWAGRKK